MSTSSKLRKAVTVESMCITPSRLKFHPAAPAFPLRIKELG